MDHIPSIHLAIVIICIIEVECKEWLAYNKCFHLNSIEISFIAKTIYDPTWLQSLLKFATIDFHINMICPICVNKSYAIRVTYNLSLILCIHIASPLAEGVWLRLDNQISSFWHALLLLLFIKRIEQCI